MTSKARILAYLNAHGEATNAQLAALFQPGEKGSLSWSQRLRDVRHDLIAQGGDLVTKHIKGGTYLYRVIRPPAPAPIFTEHNKQLQFIG